MAVGARWEEKGESAGWVGRSPTELATVVFFDPATDLDRRAGHWGHRLAAHDLSAIARFAAGLAQAEAEAWESDQPDIATRAYEARRRLLGDRLIHWAVPWLDAVVQAFPGRASQAGEDRDLLLRIGDEMRVAPESMRAEGLVAPEEDSFGPLVVDVSIEDLVTSLWSGLVLLLPASVEPGLGARYVKAARSWRDLAEHHSGSAALWLDLAARAERTAALLE